MTINDEVLNEKVQGIVLEKVCSVSADEDAKRAGVSKQVTVRVSFDGVELRDIFQAAMRPTIIKWQGPARTKYATLPKVVDIHFSEAGRRDPSTVYQDKFSKMSKEQKLAEIKKFEAMLGEDEES